MNDKLYYKIFRLTWASFCAECGKKELHQGTFEIDETEIDKFLKYDGTEEKLRFKKGFVNMKYVSGCEFVRLEEKPLEDIVELSGLGKLLQ